MANELIINTRSHETRVALVENGVVSELHIERRTGQELQGNIYRGRVVRVLPGMQAAFVDIGQNRTAFLYVSDVQKDLLDLERLMSMNSMDNDKGASAEDPVASRHNALVDISFNIEDLLKEGQDIMAQVSKEPIGSKGARVTSYISLPGRHLVLLPTVNHIWVSRRMEDQVERERLKNIIEEIRPEKVGFIVRTVSAGAEKHKLKSEMDFMLKLWADIQARMAQSTGPSLLYMDLGVSLRAVRDLFTREVDRLIIDSNEEYEKIMKFVENFAPTLKYSIELYKGNDPIFDTYGIEMEISRALDNKIWLKSGGYIVIESTEALTAIDVNTGSYVGKKNLEETILKTNLEAVKEIAYQLRLRNIGGLVVIDFIDMEKKSDREKVFNALTDALRRDKNKTNVLKMSELGLIEMTRKRTRENLTRLFREPCFYCGGEGWLKSKNSICYQIFRQIEREAWELPGDNLTLQVHPEIAGLF